MHCIVRQHKIFYKSLGMVLFFVLWIIPPSQAGIGTKRLELAQAEILENEISIVFPIVSWNEAGGLAYKAAASAMKTFALEGEQLDDSIKESLLGEFSGFIDLLGNILGLSGDPVDLVWIHWETRFLLKEWSYPADSTCCSIELENEEKKAQSYGYHIYIKAPKPSRFDRELMALLIHHMAHVQQFHEFVVRPVEDPFYEFGYRYFREYKQADDVYHMNKMEVQATMKVKEALVRIMRRYNILIGEEFNSLF